jgi:cobalt-zinc-cadmium efflux system outer membrane protein
MSYAMSHHYQRTSMRHSVFMVLVVTGCASTNIDDDIKRVSEYAHFDLPKEVATSEVDPETNDDVRELLKNPLDADTVVRVTLLNNRELRGSLRDLGIERGQLVQAGLVPNPVFQFDLRKSTRKDLPLQKDYYVEYEVTKAVLTPKRAGVAESELDAARYRVAGDVVAKAFEARAAFYALVAAEQRFAIAQKNLDTLAAARDASVAMADAGNIPGVDLANQIAAFESARARTGELELELLERREEMQTMLGLAGADTSWTAIATFAALPDDPGVPADIEKQTIVASLDLAQTKKRLEAIGKRTGLSRTEGWLPNIVVDGHFEQDFQYWERGGGASIRLPIFDHNQGLTAAYQAELDGLLERYHGLAIALRSAARRARNHVISAHTRARQYELTISPARDKVFEQTLLQYNAMQVGVFQLLQARTQQLDTELARVETVREFWTAKAAMDALLAGHAEGLHGGEH